MSDHGVIVTGAWLGLPSRSTCHTIVKTRDYVFTEYGKR
jgi:hypothetical protein